MASSSSGTATVWGRGRLQHPPGLAWGEGALWIAGSFNGKLKRCDPARREVRTVAQGLHEPGGLAWLAEGRLVVVDPASGTVTDAP